MTNPTKYGCPNCKWDDEGCWQCTMGDLSKPKIIKKEIANLIHLYNPSEVEIRPILKDQSLETVNALHTLFGGTSKLHMIDDIFDMDDISMNEQLAILSRLKQDCFKLGWTSIRLLGYAEENNKDNYYIYSDSIHVVVSRLENEEEVKIRGEKFQEFLIEIESRKQIQQDKNKVKKEIKERALLAELRAKYDE